MRNIDCRSRRARLVVNEERECLACLPICAARQPSPGKVFGKEKLLQEFQHCSSSQPFYYAPRRVHGRRGVLISDHIGQPTSRVPAFVFFGFAAAADPLCFAFRPFFPPPPFPALPLVLALAHDAACFDLALGMVPARGCGFGFGFGFGFEGAR